MALKRTTIGRLTIDDGTPVVLPLTNLTLDIATDSAVANHSGQIQPSNVMVAGAQIPTFRAQMPLKEALDEFGLDVNEYSGSDDITVTFANLEGGSVTAGSTHTSYSLIAAGYATAWIDGFSVTEGGEALADVVIHTWSDDGANDPLEEATGQALPALTAQPENHGIGIFTLNGTAIPGVTGYSYASGLSFNFQRVDGNPFATGGFPSSFDPRITVNHADPIELFAELKSSCVTISSATSITLLKYDNSKLEATGQITLTVGQGTVSNQSQSGPHGDIFNGAAEIIGSSTDGTTNPIAIS